MFMYDSLEASYTATKYKKETKNKQPTFNF